MDLSRFFQFLSGSSEAVIRDCPEAERNYHGAIGGFVLITAIAASLSGGYALYTIFHSVPMAILFGLFWGFAIGAIDRFIVMTMDLMVQGSWTKTVLAAASRLVLALFVAFVIARPLELRIFAPEINAHLQEEVQVSLGADIVAIRAELERQQLAYEGTARLAAEQDRLAALNQEHQGCLAELAVAREAYIGECDGTTGSMRVGIGPICEIKRAAHGEVKTRCDGLQERVTAGETLVAELAAENNRVYGEMRTAAEAQIAALQAAAADQMAKIEVGSAGSLLTRLDALHQISRSSDGMWWTLLFVTVLFVLVEALPVGLKLMVAGKGSYAKRLYLEERESSKRHRIERKYRERERVKHRSAIYDITEAVRTQQRARVLATIASGEDIVSNDVNLELRRRTEVESVDAVEPRSSFPPSDEWDAEVENPIHPPPPQREAETDGEDRSESPDDQDGIATGVVRVTDRIGPRRDTGA